MTQLTLWKLDSSPPACAVRIFAEILGLQLELKDVNLIEGEHKSPDFLKLNPIGTIPLLKDGEFLLSDSHAIVKYLLSKYGSPQQRETLYPSDLHTRARIDEAMFFDTGVFFAKLKAVALPTLFEGLQGPSARHLSDIDAAYAVVEAFLGNKRFIAADHLTIADLTVGATTASMQTIHKLDKEKFPRTAAWLDRLYQVPEFKKIAGLGFESLGAALQNLWKKNNA